MKTTVVCALVLGLGALCGCATNNFEKFYQDRTAGVPKDTLNQHLQPYSANTQIYSSGNLTKDGTELMRRGYVLLGESAFEWAVLVTDKELKKHANRVGADTPAFRASILPGDIIVALEETPVDSAQDFVNKVGGFA